MDSYRIVPLGPDHLQNYFAFFEKVRFPDHPDWAGCYCYSFHFTGPVEDWVPEKNREAVERLVAKGGMTGYVVYLENEIVGWCNVNDRDSYQRLQTHYAIPPGENLKIASIVCFLVHQEHRGKGLTRRILAQIEEEYRAREYHFLEAYPRMGKRSCEEHYPGPLDLYQKSGFIMVSEHEGYQVVRKSLA